MKEKKRVVELICLFSFTPLDLLHYPLLVKAKRTSADRCVLLSSVLPT